MGSGRRISTDVDKMWITQRAQDGVKIESMRIDICPRAERGKLKGGVYCIQATIGEIVWFFALLGKEMRILTFSGGKFG